MGLALHKEYSEPTGQLRLELSEAGEARFVWRGRNRYSCNRLFLTGSGVGTIRNHTAGELIEMRPGILCFMPIGLDLEFDFPAGLSFYSFHFTLELLPGLDLFTGVRECRTHPAPPGAPEELADLYAGKFNWTRAFRFNAWLWRMLATVAADGLPTAGNHPATANAAYRKLIEFVRFHSSAATTVGELAGAAGIGYDRLSREFRRDFGITLKEFQAGELRRRAERLLAAERRLSIKEIADRLGFRSEFYFSRFFKLHTGSSPRDYRDTHKLFYGNDPSYSGL